MMVKNLEGKKCPKFSAEATSEQVISNQTYKDKNVVIYFPYDPCTYRID